LARCADRNDARFFGHLSPAQRKQLLALLKEMTRLHQHKEVPVAEDFEIEAVRAAIRGAQCGRVMFPEFLRLTRAAGCVGYMAWLAGRHVAYYGRLGQMHVEHFPY